MRSIPNKPFDVAVKWREMGYKPETTSLLFLVPLIQVAWAEGFVQGSERRTILRLANDLKITPDSPGYQELIMWLNEHPSEEFFEKSNQLLRSWLDQMPLSQSESLRNILLIGCVEVARASADIGLHPKPNNIRREERRRLEHLSSQFGFSLARSC